MRRMNFSKRSLRTIYKQSTSNIDGRSNLKLFNYFEFYKISNFTQIILIFEFIFFK